MVYSIQIAVFMAWQFRENCREFQRTNYHLFCVSFLAHCFEAAQGGQIELHGSEPKIKAIKAFERDFGRIGAHLYCNRRSIHI